MAIAIIAILASILLPAIEKTRAKALGANCQANMKQLSLVVKMYVNDYNNSFPTYANNAYDGPKNADGSGGNVKKNNIAWVYTMWVNYDLQVDTFKCPMNESSGKIGWHGNVNRFKNKLPRSYVASATGDEQWWGPKNAGRTPLMPDDRNNQQLTTKVKNASNVIMLGERRGTARSEPAFETNSNNNRWRIQPHGKLTHMAFADGHVQSVRPTETIWNTGSGGGMWDIQNRKPQKYGNIEPKLIWAESQLDW